MPHGTLCAAFRQFKLGAQTIDLKHAPQWILLPTQPVTGQVVGALARLGENQAAKAWTLLMEKLSRRTLRDLVALRPALPAWMSKTISQKLLVNGSLPKILIK